MCTVIVWVIDLVLWGIVRKVLKDNKLNAEFGNANWITFGALIALSIHDSSNCEITCEFRCERVPGPDFTNQITPT